MKLNPKKNPIERYLPRISALLFRWKSDRNASTVNSARLDKKRAQRIALKAVLFTAIAILVVSVIPGKTQYHIDYAYAPHRWYTPICLIDDWQKSLVDEQGQLVYDFGPGPYAKPKTTLAVEVIDATSTTTSQTLLDARIPVIITEHTDGSKQWRQTTFALIPDNLKKPSATAPDGSFRRHEGLVGSPAWVASNPKVDAAFRSVAWGTGRSIRYDVRVPGGAERRVALSFNEVYRRGRITRLMDLQVENAPMQTVDLIQTGGRNTPQVFFFDGRDANGDGWLNIEITPSPNGQDPNVLLNGIWVFPPAHPVTAAEVIAGKATHQAETHIDAGMELLDAGHVRMDALQTEIIGPAGTLQVRLNTLRPLQVDTSSATLLFDGSPFVTTRPAFTKAIRTEQGLLLSFAAGTRKVDVLVVHGHPEKPVVFPNLTEARRRTVAYWQQAALPWGRLLVPDPKLQDLIDGGIRTMYQVREIVDGHPQFQPGATVYRGLWYGDGNWAVETVALLDDKKAAREMLEAMLMHQTDNGRFGVMKPALLHRETAHMIYGMCRYARLHQDWSWLVENWSHLERAMQHLLELRRQTSQIPNTSYHGLFPPGLTDGGIGGVGMSYGSIYWGLIAMAEAVRTARTMGRPETVVWETEFQDFLATFRQAAERDQQHDDQGNPFLPIKMDFDPSHDLPQRGQWGPIHAIYPGQFLTENDWLVTGTLAMLDARTEEKHVLSLGWLTGGLWPIFEAHRAIVYNWLGHPKKAEELLYAFANHATPTLLWAEEQLPQAKGTRIAGDVPHTVGNMQIIRLVRYLLLIERGADLELLSGLPLSWLRPGARLAALSLPTHFGPATMKLTIDETRPQGTLWIETPAEENPSGTVRLQLNRLLEAGYRFDDRGQELPDQIALPWNHLYRLVFKTTKH